MRPSSNLDSFVVKSRPPPQPIAVSKEIRDRDSVFVATVFAATSLSQAQACVKHLKNVVHAQKPADHEIHAWRCMVLKHGCTGLNGPEDFEVKEGSEDDNEKWGGDKILNTMRKQGVLDAVVIVSRWFGGTLLGPARFTHIEACTLEVCRQFKHKEDAKEALATLQTLDDVLSQLRGELASMLPPSKTPSATTKPPDYTAWIESDLPRAHRLIGARESAIRTVKALIAKHSQLSPSDPGPADH
ncbi:Ribosomal protein S5 domain 2-like protein [Mycena kentingensis (nom. inval.)]|nr:Ribosomal protein S5 domain 2-like protein [Mycena kentingensis (nom. inval.)]